MILGYFSHLSNIDRFLFPFTPQYYFQYLFHFMILLYD